MSVKFLMVGETNSVVGYNLMAEDYSIQLGVWGCYDSPSRCMAAPWWDLELFEKDFEYRP